MNTGGYDPSGHLLDFELSGKILGAAVQVRNELKPGLDEMPYGNALLIERTEQGSSIEQRKWFPVQYGNYFIRKLTPELIH